jgi:hypothetical protein
VHIGYGFTMIGLLLAGSTGQHAAGRNGLVLASKGLRWAGGSHFEFGISSSLLSRSLNWLLAGGAAPTTCASL